MITSDVEGRAAVATENHNKVSLMLNSDDGAGKGESRELGGKTIEYYNQIWIRILY